MPRTPPLRPLLPPALSPRLPRPRRGGGRPALRAGLIIPVAGITFALALPAAAQSIGTVTKPGLPDPWFGVIMISPYDEAAASASPYEAAHRAAEASAADAPPPESATPEAETAPPDPLQDTAVMPSLWESIELGLGGTPEQPEPEAPKPNQLVGQRAAPVQRARTQLPTQMELRQGAAMVSVSSSASATAPASGALATTGTSGSGELKGRIGLEQDNVTVYSTGTVGASAGPNPASASVYDNIAIGSTVSVPLAPLGLGEEKLGTRVEVDKGQTVVTGVELRAPAGRAERFISIERSQAPGAEASGLVKAGVLGKF
ncbi:hypothetical protein [Ancylobacter sp. IITR112]|uniref:hypothetical protein n=1 Tax=Ancylobacter sp. IITR112 TaxID=3138073 RepID=UPI00352B33D8